MHHGDLFVMDGCCQDEYLHCTDPRLGGGVNVTFRWIRNHLFRFPLGAGVVCCLPTRAGGSPVSTSAVCCWPGLLLPVLLLVWLGGVLLLVAGLLSTWPGRRVHACRWTRLLGGGHCRHYIRGPGRNFGRFFPGLTNFSRGLVVHFGCLVRQLGLDCTVLHIVDT